MSAARAAHHHQPLGDRRVAARAEDGRRCEPHDRPRPVALGLTCCRQQFADAIRVAACRTGGEYRARVTAARTSPRSSGLAGDLPTGHCAVAGRPKPPGKLVTMTPRRNSSRALSRNALVGVAHPATASPSAPATRSRRRSAADPAAACPSSVSAATRFQPLPPCIRQIAPRYLKIDSRPGWTAARQL